VVDVLWVDWWLSSIERQIQQSMRIKNRLIQMAQRCSQISGRHLLLRLKIMEVVLKLDAMLVALKWFRVPGAGRCRF
jgi:hypothetical protein